MVESRDPQVARRNVCAIHGAVPESWQRRGVGHEIERNSARILQDRSKGPTAENSGGDFVRCAPKSLSTPHWKLVDRKKFEEVRAVIIENRLLEFQVVSVDRPIGIVRCVQGSHVAERL